jgi:hypothetical protein
VPERSVIKIRSDPSAAFCQLRRRSIEDSDRKEKVAKKAEAPAKKRKKTDR